jgi:hypothetical protein
VSGPRPEILTTPASLSLSPPRQVAQLQVPSSAELASPSELATETEPAARLAPADGHAYASAEPAPSAKSQLQVCVRHM